MSQLLTFLVQQPVEQDEANRNSVLSTVAILIGIAVGLGTLAGFIHRWAKGQVENLMEETKKTQRKLNTKNGKSVGEYTEESNQVLDRLDKKIDVNHKTVLALVRNNSERLDRHMEGHPPKER